MDANVNTNKKTTKPRLGRGLSGMIKSLAESDLSDQPPAEGQYVSDAAAPAADSPAGLREIPIDRIARNPYQPRRSFDESELAELVRSIRQDGILQPLIVTDAKNPADGDSPYVLIAGERRLRAAKRAGIKAVPCVFRKATDQQMIEWAVIENIQRSDLNPIERARAYQQCMDRFSLSQQQVADRMGQPRATIANHLRLLDLCDEAQSLVACGQISFGHAKVLASLGGKAERQVSLARRIVSEGLSVRKLEELISKISQGPKKSHPDRPAASINIKKPPYVLDAERRLSETIGTRVTIMPARAKNTGRIVLEYYNLDDFERIAGALGLDGQD